MAKQATAGAAPLKVVSGEAVHPLEGATDVQQIDPLTAARELLLAEERKKDQAFYDAYLALCKEYGREIRAETQLVLRPVQ